MVLLEFYSAAAAVCFALLGLWWVVVQFRFGEWMADRARRRVAYHVSLYFALPGTMSLVSLLAVRVTYLWRVGFGIAGALGLLETVLAMRTLRVGATRRWAVQAIRWVAAVLYVLVVVFAVDPTIAADLGTQLRALEIEGAMLSVLILLGVNFAWLMFVEQAEAPQAPE